MSQPVLSDRTTVVSGLTVNVPLRFASLAAGIPILFLRQELGSEALIVFVTLLFYLGPYLLIGFAPPLKRPFQVGFAAGYAFAMSVALVIYFVARSLGSPTSAAIKAAGKKLDMGKCCVHFESPGDLPLEAIGKLISAISSEKWIEMYEQTRLMTKAGQAQRSKQGAPSASKVAAKRVGSPQKQKAPTRQLGRTFLQH
jgi:hypothetical protein